MITRYTKPAELIDEFKQDRERARYWLRRMIAKHNSSQGKSFQNFKSVAYNQQKDARSEVFEYDSPKFGNKWLLLWRYISNGYGAGVRGADGAGARRGAPDGVQTGQL